MPTMTSDKLVIVGILCSIESILTADSRICLFNKKKIKYLSILIPSLFASVQRQK